MEPAVDDAIGRTIDEDVGRCSDASHAAVAKAKSTVGITTTCEQLTQQQLRPATTERSTIATTPSTTTAELSQGVQDADRCFDMNSSHFALRGHGEYSSPVDDHMLGRRPEGGRESTGGSGGGGVIGEGDHRTHYKDDKRSIHDHSRLQRIWTQLLRIIQIHDSNLAPRTRDAFPRIAFWRHEGQVTHKHMIHSPR